jgi:hypothetical protein
MPDFGTNIATLNEFGALLEKRQRKIFNDDLPSHQKLYTAWLRETTAKQITEDSLRVTGFGPMGEKAPGEEFSSDKPFISDTKNRTLKFYGMAYKIEYELIRWDKYDVMDDATKAMTASGVHRKNLLAYSIINNAISASSSVYQTYNGDNLIAAAHTTLRGATAKNKSTAPVAVSYLGLQEGLADFRLLVNEDGLQMALTPAILVVHETKRWVAETLLGSEYRPDNANMSLNTLKKAGLTVHSSPFITDEDAWFILSAPSSSQRKDMFEVGDDFKFRRSFIEATLVNMFSIYASFRVSVFDWYGWWGSEGA